MNVKHPDRPLKMFPARPAPHIDEHTTARPCGFSTEHQRVPLCVGKYGSPPFLMFAFRYQL